MIRDIRPLQSADQSRLRDDNHRHEEAGAFTRHLIAVEEAQEQFAPKKQTGTQVPSPNLSGNNAMWSQFFADLDRSNANDSTPLFHWGEQRENAKQHTQTAQRSALLSGNTPFHLLNEKI